MGDIPELLASQNGDAGDNDKMMEAPMSPSASTLSTNADHIDDLLDAVLGPSSPMSNKQPLTCPDPAPVIPDPVPPPVKRMVTPTSHGSKPRRPDVTPSGGRVPAYARPNKASILRAQFQQEKCANIRASATPPRRPNRNLYGTNSYGTPIAGNPPSNASKATTQRNRDARLPSAKSSTSVFDRLYRTQTVASRNWANQARGVSDQNRRVVGVKVDDEAAKIFNRLNISGTVSNNSKRLSNYMERSSIRKGRQPFSFSPTGSASITASVTPSRTSTGCLIYSPRMKPKTRLLFCSRYHPGLGEEEMRPISLGYSFFQQFCDYESGNMTARELACDIIIAFFKKDYPSDREWQVEDPSVFEVPDSNKTAFRVQMRAMHRYQGKFQVACGKGVIRFCPEKDEVRIEDYLYSTSTSHASPRRR